MTAPSLDLVFWGTSVAGYEFRERVKAARAGGFSSLAITPYEYRAAIAGGLKAVDLVELAGESGVALSHIDTLTDWTPIRYPAGSPDFLVERFDFAQSEVLDIASAVGARTVLAFAGFGPGSVATDVAIAGFAELCDRADRRGLWIDLEFAPIAGLPDLSDAWEIVRLADRANSGIMFDTWHFARGDADMDLLREIPGERLRAVQLADATIELRAATLLDDCVRFRKFPGEGELPIIDPLRVIHEKGFLRSIGPEVFSDAAELLSAHEAGLKSGETLRRTLEAAGIS